MRPGTSFAVFGAGSVGLSAVLGARVAGASKIFAIDVNKRRLDLAMELGATHVINSMEHSPVEEIRKVTGRGVNASLDTTGIVKVLRSAVECLSSRGTCGFVGVSDLGTNIEVDMYDVMLNSKHILGIVEGNAVPDIFIPRLIDLYMEGRFPIDKLVTYYDFEDINQATSDMVSGSTIKPVLKI